MDLLNKPPIQLNPMDLFPDKRLGNRLNTILTTIDTADLHNSFPKIFDKKSLKGLYRFVEHPEINHYMLTKYFANRSLSVLPKKECFFLIQDTTQLLVGNFVKGAGVLNNKRGQGEHLHTCLLTDMNGIPICIAQQTVLHRTEDEYGKKHYRHTRAFESKESFKWAAGLIKGHEICAEYDIRVIHVMDREGDCSDVFNYAYEYNQHLIVRALHDRDIENDPEVKKLRDVKKYKNTELCCRQLLDKKGSKQEAVCRISWQKVKLANIEQELYAVHLVSLETDLDVEWLLLTTIPIESLEMAQEIVDGYVRRWLIEEFHKCLKSGCSVEERRFTTIETYLNCVALLSQGAINLLRMKCLSDKEPDRNIATELSSEERVLLPKLADKHLSPKEQTLFEPFTAAWMIAIIANMGGFRRGTNRKPGWEVLWTGYQKYLHILEGFSLATLDNKNDDTG